MRVILQEIRQTRTAQQIAQFGRFTWQEMIEFMGKLINHQKAKKFLDQLDDPVIQALIQDAYARIFSEGITEFKGKFDLLFFYQILAAFLHDRESLARALRGELDRHPIVAD